MSCRFWKRKEQEKYDHCELNSSAHTRGTSAPVYACPPDAHTPLGKRVGLSHPVGALFFPLGCFAAAGQDRNARNAKSRHTALCPVPSVPCSPPTSCPPLPWPVTRTGYSPERRATYTHTRLVIRKKHSVSVWNGLSLTVWPPALPCGAVGKALTHDGIRASGQQWVRSSKATSMAKAGGEH